MNIEFARAIGFAVTAEVVPVLILSHSAEFVTAVDFALTTNLVWLEVQL